MVDALTTTAYPDLPSNIAKTVALTDAATISWDVGQAENASITLGGSRTMAAPTNLEDGGIYTLRVKQDGTGSRTITWNAVFKWAASTAPTLTATAAGLDILQFISDGTNLYQIGKTQALG
jgi:hypothetical protein